MPKNVPDVQAWRSRSDRCARKCAHDGPKPTQNQRTPANEEKENPSVSPRVTEGVQDQTRIRRPALPSYGWSSASLQGSGELLSNCFPPRRRAGDHASCYAQGYARDGLEHSPNGPTPASGEKKNPSVSRRLTEGMRADVRIDSPVC